MPEEGDVLKDHSQRFGMTLLWMNSMAFKRYARHVVLRYRPVTTDFARGVVQRSTPRLLRGGSHSENLTESVTICSPCSPEIIQRQMTLMTPPRPGGFGLSFHLSPSNKGTSPEVLIAVHALSQTNQVVSMTELRRLEVASRVYRRVLHELNRAGTVEVGGAFVGHIVASESGGVDAHVLDFIPAGPHPEEATDVAFLADRVYQLWTFQRLLEVQPDLSVLP